MVVTAEAIQAYEEAYRPTAIAPLSANPKAWRVESLVDIGPSGIYTPDQPRLFILTGQQLVVAGSESASLYKQCNRTP